MHLTENPCFTLVLAFLVVAFGYGWEWGYAVATGGLIGIAVSQFSDIFR